MAPQRPTVPEHIIERTDEYNDFIAKLRAYHEKRGTHFDPEPKVGTTHVDLLKIFKHIVDHGGYDKVTDEKLAWRKMCNGLGLFSSNEAAAAFSLKSVYYKYLAAYEISTIHNKEPPPPEILEHLTAKGGSLLTRTLENYGHVLRRDPAPDRSEQSGDDGTPARDRRENDTPGSGRASRGLREAPPQRVIFQPDTGPSRQSRHPSGQHAHSHPATPGSHGHIQSQPHATPQHMSAHGPAAAPQQQFPRGPSFIFNPPNLENYSPVVQNFEPRALLPLPLRPVDTPGNNSVEFARRQRQRRIEAAGVSPGQGPRPLIPGAGSEGPNIYVRCLQALRSKIPAEQAYAVHHLVRISYERGDKYRFESFHGLAEGLVEKALEVGRLFYHVDWEIAYDADAAEGDVSKLDGENGTADILDRIASLMPKDFQDGIQPAEFMDQMTQIVEATLTIRNMVMLPDNATFMADYAPVKDLLCIILNLPQGETVVELKHFALDIAEQLTPFLALDAEDPLYQTLLAQLSSPDRGVVLTALRAIGRISMNLADTNRLGSVQPTVLQSIMNWLLLNDDEFLDACLDFLYQYTAVVSNVETVLESISAENLVSHLVRLLSHGAKRVLREQILEPERKSFGVGSIVALPDDLRERLVAIEEPERCQAWLKCLFWEDSDSDVLQIAIWSSYQKSFGSRLAEMNRPMISPADFIRNINHVWQSAYAQIVRAVSPQGEVQKFIIKGIRPRSLPVDPDNKEYMQCLWSKPEDYYRKCGEFFANPQKMYTHILAAHLGAQAIEDNRWVDREQEYRCVWAGCTKYIKGEKMRLSQLMQHVKTHLEAAYQQRDPAWRPFIRPATTLKLVYEETATTRDERNPNAPPQAAGIPLSAALILRNIARNVVKTESEEKLLESGEEPDNNPRSANGWNERLFRTMMPRLYEVMAENKALAPYITSLLEFIEEDRRRKW